METIACIFCGKNSDRIVIEENGYTGRRCERCGLIYVSPRPTFAEMVQFYQHDNAQFTTETHLAHFRGNRFCARHNIRIIQRFIKAGAMLEIGAGSGYFLYEARKKGFDVYANEYNPVLADFIQTKLGIPCVNEVLHAGHFKGKKFDIIYHREVLSHFFDPISDFQKLSDMLNPGDFMVFETGNGGDIDSKYYPLFEKFQFPDHLFLFSENSLRELLNRTGFETRAIYRYSIIVQLFLTKKLSRLVRFMRPRNKAKLQVQMQTAQVPRSGAGRSGPPGSCIRQFMLTLALGVLYIIRYRIGSVLPKEGKPQTIIIVAQKK